MSPAEAASPPASGPHIAAYTNPRRDAVPAERRFFVTMSAICALLIFAGFSPSFYLKDVIHAPPPLSAMSRVHGIVSTGWVLVFLLQASLIGFNKAALHRRIGVLAALLFGLVAATGIMTAINAARLGHAPPGSPPALVFMVVPITGILVATILVISALWNRGQRDFHQRYMLAAFIAITPPATHRIAVSMGMPEQALWIGLGIADILLAAGIVYDIRSRKSVHPAYVWSALVYIATQGGIIWAYGSPAWPPIANWLIQA